MRIIISFDESNSAFCAVDARFRYAVERGEHTCVELDGGDEIAGAQLLRDVNETIRDADALEARDDRVHGAISDVLCDLTVRIAQLKDQLRTAEASKRFVIGAVEAGHWWKLRKELSEDDIESLCNIDDGGRIEDWLRSSKWGER